MRGRWMGGSQQLLPSTRYSHSTQQGCTMKPLLPLCAYECVRVFVRTHAQRHNGCADCCSCVFQEDKEALHGI